MILAGKTMFRKKQMGTVNRTHHIPSTTPYLSAHQSVTVKKLIKDTMKREGITIAELAEKMGIKYHTLNGSLYQRVSLNVFYKFQDYINKKRDVRL